MSTARSGPHTAASYTNASSAAEQILSRLRHVRRDRQGWSALCAAHDDQNSSLSVAEGEEGRVLLKCFAGCPTEAIVAAIGLSMADLFPPKPLESRRKTTRVAHYDYRGADGRLLYQVLRYEPKAFRQRRPGQDGGWIWNLDGVHRVLYRLVELLAADPSDPVFVVEGEKDADRLAREGALATTNPGGAGKWSETYNPFLQDRHIVILPDSDSAGQRHAHDVAQYLSGVAASLKVLHLPGLPPKGDVSDWLNSGHGFGELRSLAEATPIWESRRQEAEMEARSASDGPRFPRTDAGNGEMFAQILGNRVRYDHRRNRWLLWSGHRWSPDCAAAIRSMAKDAARRRYLGAVRFTDEKDRKAEALWAIASESRQRVEAALYFAQAEKPISDTGDGWDSDPWLLGCTNGVVDLRTGEVRPGRPEDRITLNTGLPFEPQAVAPRWEQFLVEVFAGDSDVIDWVHRALGYGATGDTREQIVCLLHGSGSNGKSVFCTAVRSTLGDYAYNAPFATVEMEHRAQIPNDLAALACRRFVTAAETNEGVRLNEARVKTLSGGDPITARFLNQEFFTYQPMLKLWLCVNHLPRVRDLSYGFWRRVRTIPFLQRFQGEAQDKALAATLKAEANGILAWIVRGAVEWQRRGLEPIPEPVQHATASYREESDPLSEFLRERCVVAGNASAAGAELYKAYTAWADDWGIAKHERLGSRTFGERMTERFEKRHGEYGRRYRGVGLLADGSPVSSTSDLDTNPITQERSETPVSTRQPSAKPPEASDP